MQPCLNPVTASVPGPDDYVRLAVKNGFRGVDHGADFWIKWVNETSLDHVQDFCAAQQCAIAHGGLPTNFREGDALFEAELEALPDACRIMKAFNTRGMSTWIAPAAPGNVSEFRIMHVNRLKRVAEVLADHGLKLGLEFVGPKTSRTQGTPFVHDMPGMLDLCADIDPATCGLLLDSYHWYTAHATAEDIRRLRAEQIVHVHINDAYPGPIDELQDMHRLLPGEGVIDLDGFLGALQHIGYDGPAAVETFSDELKQLGPEEAARRAGEATLRVLHNFL